MGVDFAGPLVYRKNDKSEGKAYIIIFTCGVTRAVHLETSKSQSVEEFKSKLNSFITSKARPKFDSVGQCHCFLGYSEMDSYDTKERAIAESSCHSGDSLEI